MFLQQTEFRTTPRCYFSLFSVGQGQNCKNQQGLQVPADRLKKLDLTFLDALVLKEPMRPDPLTLKPTKYIFQKINKNFSETQSRESECVTVCSCHSLSPCL